MNQQLLKCFIYCSFQCPDQSCKQDLVAYLEQIKLYSHQLKICSQVKAEIQNLGGELIMSAVSRKTASITLLVKLQVTFDLGFPVLAACSSVTPNPVLFSLLTPTEQREPRTVKRRTYSFKGIAIPFFLNSLNALCVITVTLK